MNWEAVGSVGAVLVAVVALVAAIVEGRAARKHNRLSVRPLLRIDCYENEGISLHNTGAGPAILQEFLVFADGRQVEATDDSPAALVAAEAVGLWSLLPQPQPDEDQLSAYTPDVGDSLMAQERFNLLGINILPVEREDRAAVFAALQRITFRIRYASVYEEEQVYE